MVVPHFAPRQANPFGLAATSGHAGREHQFRLGSPPLLIAGNPRATIRTESANSTRPQGHLHRVKAR